MNKRIVLLLSLFIAFCQLISAQKVLQIERYGRAETEKIFIGNEIVYRLNGNDYFLRGYIEDLHIENNVIVLPDRYVPVSEINALQYNRGWPRAIGTSIFWFGLGWSALAAVGTATDGDASTNYRWSDAAVTGTSFVISFALPKLFGRHTLKFGKRKRLRMLDINFYPSSDPTKLKR